MQYYSLQVFFASLTHKCQYLTMEACLIVMFCTFQHFSIFDLHTFSH